MRKCAGEEYFCAIFFCKFFDKKMNLVRFFVVFVEFASAKRFIPPFVWKGTVWPQPQNIRQETIYCPVAPNLQFEPGLPKNIFK